ncbi:AzlC family ABC transporter permease [Anaerobiospirillum thomasii]|uniref:Inner membrane protein YgaZ n=1 Tax=Anaerobiospirillum thomasii TaxID=179995 RepID=A0A2X0VKR1_9GAMM|nr:AzlC family ABC transporter permease [Anaerobiospirillum thomasii]SPT70048.1 Inner membrane protein YgaZ [Anaerobiospirillum thomasii]
MKLKAFKAALPHTLPICVAFLFLGMSYGFFMKSEGFSFIYPMLMSLLIFAGSMEFITVALLLGTFNPLYALLMALMVNARHLFYGISMLDKYKNTGLKKFYLIFGMCDESFTINCTTKIPADVDKGYFMFFVTMLNHIYWVAGATLGALLGYVVSFDTTGIEFVMTALFVVIFLNQWDSVKNHTPALTGLICTFICLVLFGSDHFIVPAMLGIILIFSMLRRKLEVF